MRAAGNHGEELSLPDPSSSREASTPPALDEPVMTTPHGKGYLPSSSFALDGESPNTGFGISSASQAAEPLTSTSTAKTIGSPISTDSPSHYDLQQGSSSNMMSNSSQSLSTPSLQTLKGAGFNFGAGTPPVTLAASPATEALAGHHGQVSWGFGKVEGNPPLGSTGKSGSSLEPVDRSSLASSPASMYQFASPDSPSSPPPTTKPRAATYPRNPLSSSSGSTKYTTFSPSDFLPLLISSESAGMEAPLLLDIRPNTAFQAARIRGSLSICVPSTLLRRPAYGVERVQEGLLDHERDVFETWKDRSCIVVLDGAQVGGGGISGSKPGQTFPNSGIGCLLAKFEKAGYEGTLGCIKGGFTALRNEAVNTRKTGVLEFGRSQRPSSISGNVGGRGSLSNGNQSDSVIAQTPSQATSAASGAGGDTSYFGQEVSSLQPKSSDSTSIHKKHPRGPVLQVRDLPIAAFQESSTSAFAHAGLPSASISRSSLSIQKQGGGSSFMSPSTGISSATDFGDPLSTFDSGFGPFTPQAGIRSLGAFDSSGGAYLNANAGSGSSNGSSGTGGRPGMGKRRKSGNGPQSGSPKGDGADVFNLPIGDEEVATKGIESIRRSRSIRNGSSPIHHHHHHQVARKEGSASVTKIGQPDFIVQEGQGSRTNPPIFNTTLNADKSQDFKAGNLTSMSFGRDMAFHMPFGGVSGTSTAGGGRAGQGVLGTGESKDDMSVGGSSAGERRMATNPFFDNIRQNAEALSLSRSLENLSPVELPEVSAQSFEGLPPFLQKLLLLPPLDRSHFLATQFYELEVAERERLEGTLKWHAQVQDKQVLNGAEGEEAKKFKKFGISAGVELGNLNRFKNIFPYDHARVHLKNFTRGATDYVNASHLHLQSSRKKFIASQGPLVSTFNDFWQIVDQEECGVIIMLTNVHEGGREKCGKYWIERPESEWEIKLEGGDPEEDRSFNDSTMDGGAGGAGGFFDPASVGEDSSTESNATIRQTIYFKRKGTAPDIPARRVRHIHYRAWPDFDLPAKPSDVVALVREVEEIQKEYMKEIGWNVEERGGVEPAILAHCSAGVGRTGVFIMVSTMLAKLREDRQKAWNTKQDSTQSRGPYRQREESHDSMDIDGDEQEKDLPSSLGTVPSSSHLQQSLPLPPSSNGEGIKLRLNPHFRSLSPGILPSPTSSDTASISAGLSASTLEGRRGSTSSSVHSIPLSASPLSTPKPTPPIPISKNSTTFCHEEGDTIDFDGIQQIAAIQQDDPIYAGVNEMREQRMSCVANYRQYICVHECVLAGVLQEIEEEQKLLES